MASNSRDLDAVRAGRSELENHYIDELLAGHIAAVSSSAAVR